MQRVRSGRREHEDADRGGTPEIFWKYPRILLCGSGSVPKCKQQDMHEELDII